MRPMQIMLDSMTTDGYGKLTDVSQQREEWRRHTCTLEPAYGGREPKEEDDKQSACKYSIFSIVAGNFTYI